MKFFALYLFNIREVQNRSTKNCLKSFLDFVNYFDVQYLIKACWFLSVQVLFRDKYSELYHLAYSFLNS